MPTKRLPDPPGWIGGMPCLSREHLPPTQMVYKPGRYEHTCPSCGHVTRFYVAPVTA